MRRGEQHRLRAVRLVQHRAAVVDAEHDRSEAGGGESLGRMRLAVVLDRDPGDADVRQHLAQQRESLREPGADDDPVRRDPHPAGAAQVRGQHGAQFRPAPGIAVAQRPAGRAGQRLARRGQPPGSGKRRQVRRSGAQVVPGRPDPEWRPDAGRGPRGGRGRAGDPRARALPGGQPALRTELGVRLGDRVAGDSQVGGQRPGRWQPCPRRQPPGLHGLAKRRLQPGPHPVPGQFQVQVYPGNGPCFHHKSGA